MKTYKITEEEKINIIYLLNAHSILAAKNILNKLEEIKEENET